MRRARSLCGALLLLSACGSRSGLLEPAGLTPGDGPRRDAAIVRVDGVPVGPPPCPLLAWHEPFAIFAPAGRSAEAPSLVVLDPGGASGAASVALQAFASDGTSTHEIDVARLRVALPWPSATVIDKAAVLVGNDSHGWGEMVRAPSGAALAWHGDPSWHGRPMFRLLDASTWTPGAAADIAADGEAVIDLAAGRGVALAQWDAAVGYAVTWRDVQADKDASTRPLVAVLDETGHKRLGPFVAAAAAKYPGRSPALLWSGTTYLAATSFDGCASGDKLCAQRSVVITSIKPPSGDYVDDSALVYVTAIPSGKPSRLPGRAALAEHAGSVWAAWSEQEASDPPETALRTIRLARLTPDGKLVGAPLTIAEGLPTTSAPLVAATPLGVVLTWAEEGDRSLAYHQVGRSRIVVHWLDGDGKSRFGRHEIAATYYDDYGRVQAVYLAEPRGVVLTWAGTPVGKSGQTVVYLAAATCGNPK